MPPLVSGHYSEDLLDRLNNLRHDHHYSDCQIVLSRTNTSTHRPINESAHEFHLHKNVLFVHRVILAAVSPYLDRLFSTRPPELITILDLTEYCPKTVRVVVSFIYSGQLNLGSSDPTLVHQLAARFEIKSLQQILSHLVLSPNRIETTNQLKRTCTPDTINDKPGPIQDTSTKKPKLVHPNPSKCPTPHGFLSKYCPKSCFGGGSIMSTSDFYQNDPIHPRTAFEPASACQWSGEERALTNSTMIPSPAGLILPMPSPLSSGIHSGGPYSSPVRPASGPVQTPNKVKVKSQGVRTSPPHLMNDETLEKDEGWCRNKKYIERVPNGFMCTVCHKVYGRYNSVSYHVTIYHRNPPIRCDQTGCSFTTREARYIHFHKYYRHNTPLPSSIDLGPRSCPYCKHVAKSPGMLDKHIRRHEHNQARLANQQRASVICNETPPTVNLPYTNMITPDKTRSDNGRPKSLECQACSYRTQSAEALQQHKLFKHSPDTFTNRFECPSCPFQTSSPQALDTHLVSSHSNSPDKSDDSRLVNIGGDEHGTGPASSPPPANLTVDEEENENVIIDSPSAPPPSYCSESPPDKSPTSTPNDSKSSSLDDEHSALAATQSTGYHSMVNYGVV